MHIPTWLANFSGYWKEVSVVLTGLFAVLGLAGEYKDKDTGRLTVWGRTFLVLTIVSIGFGLIAQIQDNKDSDRLLKRTQQSVYQLSRIIQAFDEPTIWVIFKINCSSERFKEYCDKLLAEQKRRKQAAGTMGTTSAYYSTTGFPGGPQVLIPIFIHFYKDKEESDGAIFDGAIASDVNDGDTTMKLQISNYAKNADLKVISVTEPFFELVGTGYKVSVDLHNQKIMSVPDLPGSTIVIATEGDQFNGLTLESLTIRTPRGQAVDIAPDPRVAYGHLIFVHTFPADPSADDR